MRRLILAICLSCQVGQQAFGETEGERLPELVKMSSAEMETLVEFPLWLPPVGTAVDLTGYQINDPVWIGDPGWIVAPVMKTRRRRGTEEENYSDQSTVSHILTIDVKSRECRGFKISQPHGRAESNGKLVSCSPGDGDRCLLVFDELTVDNQHHEFSISAVNIAAGKVSRLDWTGSFNPHRTLAVLNPDRFNVSAKRDGEALRVLDKTNGSVAPLDIEIAILGNTGRLLSEHSPRQSLAFGIGDGDIIICDSREKRPIKIECVDCTRNGTTKWIIDRPVLEKLVGGEPRQVVAPMFTRRPCRRLPVFVHSSHQNRLKLSVALISTYDGEILSCIEIPKVYGAAGYHAVVSPNSRWLIFHATLNGHYRLFCLDLEASSIKHDDNPYSRVLDRPFGVSNDGVVFMANPNQIWAEYPQSDWSTRPMFSLWKRSED